MNKLVKISFTLGLALLVCATGSDVMAQKKKKKATKKPAKTAAPAPAPAPVEQAVAPAGRPFKQLPADSVDYNAEGINALSVSPIHYSRVMYRMKIRRRVDMMEKCNTPFRNTNHEFMKYLLEGFQRGLIQGFEPDTCRTYVYADDKGVMAATTYKDDNTGETYSVKARDLTFFEIYEDLLFDRQRSVTTYDIQHIVLKVPAGAIQGITVDQGVAAFRYKDLEAYFAKLPVDARWKNPINNREDRSFSEAFRLRLFCGRITRIAKDNPTEADLNQLPEYNTSSRATLLASQRMEYDLVSQENELYEY